MSRVEVSHLYKTYDLDGHPINALRDVTFTLEDSSFITVVGKSGCGKTTLLRVILGLEKQTSGEVRVMSGNGQGPHRISIVFQEPRLMPWLTVKQNMAFALTKRNDRRRVEETVDVYLDLLGLTAFKDAYPSQISGGMAQRVALGRTLCFDPDIILMDEPFGALDAFTRRKLQEELIDIALTQRKTVLFVTHDIDEAIFMGQRVLILNEGQLIRDIPVELDYPRDPLSRGYFILREEILNAFFGREGI